MRLFTKPWIMLIICGVFTITTLPDSYIRFSAKRVYSANKHYLIHILENQKATFFSTNKKTIKKWNIKLPFLPETVLVANNGKRVILIDHYYGNKRDPEAVVVLILDDTGNALVSFKLKDILSVNRLVKTTSTAYWQTDLKLVDNESKLSIATAIRQAEPEQCLAPSKPPIEGCFLQKPFEELIFDLTTGELIERKKI